MFRPSEKDNLQKQLDAAESNYVIQKNDILSLQVFTNNGEKIIDPNLESFKEGTQQSQSDVSPITYLVDASGVVKFPLIGKIKLEGLTIRQAEEILEKEFAVAYKGTYVILKFVNKRVVVLGAPGGQVIPLANENTRLTEILALAKGINNDARANNIRVLRSDQIMIADLTTFEGYQKYNIIMQPGDVVYVEPIRRPFIEGFREYGPIFSIITSVGTLIFVITQAAK